MLGLVALSVATDVIKTSAGDFVCYHEVLSVPATTNNKHEITRAFRSAAKRSHPDMPRGSQQKFIHLKDAYQAMVDDEKRAAYQQALENPKHAHTCQEQRRRTRWDVARHQRGWQTGRELGMQAGNAVYRAASATAKGAAWLGGLIVKAAITEASIIKYDDDVPLQKKPMDVCEASVQNLVYVDNSGSMLENNLKQAHSIFKDIAPSFHGRHAPRLRLIVFGSEKRETAVSTNSARTVRGLMERWNGRGGGTYMWHMILDDIQKKYPIERCRSTLFRVYVITDGQDTASPKPFKGMQGMDPMMQRLRSAGFEIEFHIIVVGDSVSRLDNQRYQSLAQATGGLFLSLGRASHRERKQFIGRTAQYSKATANKAKGLREAERRKYEAAIEQGRAKKFEWYMPLPQPI
jgi:curved DNA-binding protein CbpA